MGLHFAARRAMKGHEYGMRKYSFFEGSSFNIRDIIVFIKYYLECHTLLQCSKSANMDYKNTSVNWASYIRELFCQYVSTIYDYTEFEGEVELDESLFGRKVKYHRGNSSGLRIWIFGIVERSTNRIVLYPVDDRSANTLVPLIQKHVKPGSRIFSDSWAAYNTLNDIGMILDMNISALFIRHLLSRNMIEGAWKIAKDHFRAMNGTNTKMFEQHLCEIIWRNHHYRSDLYQSFFDLVNSVYTLDGPPRFNYQKPVIKTWTPPTKEDEKAHNITIVPDTEDELVEPSVEHYPWSPI
ncbi:unnamed protein product [Mytilus edulis]|uniref:ISXO2-like transposase domain-containing protein n=1 Tax=Mytilus edulis TaxID=6550 RepID=A0A8S3QUT8_MYTED|nr:unnamed protein product [Mytilus edulis]